MKRFIQFFLLLLPLVAGAESKFTFEPIYGVETSLVRFPEPPRYVTRATYGFRMLYGPPALSGEAEYSTATSRQDYPGSNMQVEDQSQRASLGLRTTLPATQYFDFYLRAGGRASKGYTKVVTNGVVDRHENPISFDPYAGAGAQFRFASNLALNGGVTLIRNLAGQYDTQYTLGFNARFGNP